MNAALSGEPEEELELRATLVDHLDELRDRILRSLMAVALCWVAGYYVEPYVYPLLIGPLKQVKSANVEEVFRNFAAPFFLRLQVGLILGLIIAAPIVTLQLWAFIRPGLKKTEQRIARIVGPASILLFLFGIALAWYILPMGFRWFLGYMEDFQGAKLYQDPKEYVSFVLKMFLAFGAGFQLPIVMVALVKLGILSEEFLWRNWRQATVFIAVGAMILTPSGDVFSMMMMFLPMLMLYFGSAVVIRVLSRPKRKALTLKNERE